MTIRTVKDLIQEMEDLNNPDAPIRIASNNMTAAGIAAAVEGEEDCIVYLVAGAQAGFVPADVRFQT